MDKIKIYPKVGRLYKHYKGGTYKVLSLANHTETNEPLVIYQSIEYGGFHARPLDKWFENINDRFEDSKAVYRFALIDEK